MSAGMQPLQRQNIRLAATVVLMREPPTGLEVFMMQRPGGVDFPDLHVFPGGKVDEQDLLEDWVSGCSEAEANRLLGLQAGGLRYWVTAIRECFEECGVLLARKQGMFLEVHHAEELTRFEGYRELLINGEMTMSDLCEREDLVLAADCLLYFSHWLTPESAPRRFDTRFFIARMPVKQDTAAHEWETAGEHWVAADAALKAAAEGTWQMISPTTVTLTSIANYHSVSEVFAAVEAETHLPILTDDLHHQGMQTLR